MSGLYRGKIECVINTGSRSSHIQTCFKNLYDFFTSHPNYTVIALQYGATTPLVPGSTSSGTGTGYYDQANSFGYNAFFVVRANATAARPFDVYHMFQWCGAPNQDGAPANNATAASTPVTMYAFSSGLYNNGSVAGVAYQCAIGVGGTGGSVLSPNNGNPWKGTQNGNGADIKGSPVWGAPAGGGTGVIIFPRSNDGPDGTHRSLTQNMVGVMRCDFTVGQKRMNVVADDDNFVIYTDHDDSSNFYMSYSGLYVPRPNIPASISPIYPYVAINSVNVLPWVTSNQSVYGDLAGTSGQQGGIVGMLSASCCSLQLDQWSNNFLVDSNFWPDHQMPGNPYNEFPMHVGIYEYTPPTTQNNLRLSQCGYLGTVDFIHEMFNVPTYNTRPDFSRIFVGSTTLASKHYAVPWDSQNNTVPRSGTTRQGITFVAAKG